jgi:predicted transcriptional regulator
MNGVLCYAFKNDKVDYIKQAEFLAKQVKKFLGLPTSIITDTNVTSNEFDNVIKLSSSESVNSKRYYKNSTEYEVTDFKNRKRSQAYKLTPYENTLLLDTDYVINSDKFKQAFNSEDDFLIFKDSYDISNWRNNTQFQYINDSSIKFYWATCVYFKKTNENEIFFNLVEHIEENWENYNYIYNFNSSLFRNDYAFSLAIHIMNGFHDTGWVKTFGWKKCYAQDKDILLKLKENDLIFLTEEHRSSEYILTKISNTDIHVMNKFSLEECING